MGNPVTCTWIHYLFFGCCLLKSRGERMAYHQDRVTKKRQLCVKDSHARAWVAVKNFMEQNLMVFPSRMDHAESTLMPAAKNWLKTSLDEMNWYSAEDHCIYLWLNCPTVGIIPSDKYDYFLTCITNFLSDWPKNSMAVIVYPNRAGQLDKRIGDILPWSWLWLSKLILAYYLLNIASYLIGTKSQAKRC